MRKIAVIDCGMGNLDSIACAIRACGSRVIVTNSERDILSADSLVFPGMGSFADGMSSLRRMGLDEILYEKVVEKEAPFLGICLGMQLLAERGIEGGETKGLGWIGGEVRKLEAAGPDTKIPHIGWNEVVFIRDSPLFKGVPSGKDFYFVHSYHFACINEENILTRTPYCGNFVSAVYKDNIFGLQFHPEKSQRFGLQLIRNFLSF